MFNFVAPHHYHFIKVKVGENSRTEKVYGSPSESTYYHMVRAFVNQIRTGEKAPTDAEDAVKTMKVIDSIYQKAGLKKRGETFKEEENI
jgi:predicted dehydrogenase